MRRNLNLGNIATIAVCCSIFVYLFIPILSKDKDRPSSSVITAKILSQAALAYAEDNNDTLPRVDNNGACIYGEHPCSFPELGSMELRGVPIERAARVMFMGLIVPYSSEYRDRWYSTELGATDWQSVYRDRSTLRFDMPSYNPIHHNYYDRMLNQVAVNAWIAENYMRNPFTIGNRPNAPRGNLNRVTNHPGKILMTMQSAWTWGLGIKHGLGSSIVTPSYPKQGCANWNYEGFTAYVVGVKPGDGQKWTNHPDRAKLNPNYQGMATFAFVDGHVEQLKFAQSEACVSVPEGQVWQYTRNGTLKTYYPKWVPEIP